jgi:SAM-dependent methyltransferase
MAGLHENRRRACSFGAAAEQYDRARPSYPAALIDDLTAEGARTVLDVGCGTGKASRLFLERGCDVLGVEPDPAMALLARSHGVTVEDAMFEDWDPAGRMFDLVVSGQAWHWVDPDVGLAKAAAVLRDGGRFAAFWNIDSYDAETSASLRRAYERVAPTLVDGSSHGGMAAAVRAPERNDEEDLASLRASGSFRDDEVRRYPWSQTYPAASWLERVSTHSDHRTLPPEQLAALLEELRVAIDDRGGEIAVQYETLVLTARRAGGTTGSS